MSYEMADSELLCNAQSGGRGHEKNVRKTPTLIDAELAPGRPNICSSRALLSSHLNQPICGRDDLLIYYPGFESRRHVVKMDVDENPCLMNVLF